MHFAADGSDFKIGYYYFNIAPHVNEAYIKIPIFNDNKEEKTESFAVSVSMDKERRYTVWDPFLAEVIIEDGQYPALHMYPVYCKRVTMCTVSMYFNPGIA